MSIETHSIVTVPPFPPGPRPPADLKLAKLAAALITRAQDNDEAGVARLLETVEPYRLVRLFMLLGCSAKPDDVLMAAGFSTPEHLRWCCNMYDAMRRRGVPRAEIPADIVQGWRTERRLRRRTKAAKAA